MIQAREGGDILHVRPRKTPIEQRQFKPTHRVDEVVEQGCKSSVEAVVVFLGGISDEIEISSDQPGPRDKRAKRNHLLSESRRERVIGGGVDICDCEGEIGSGGSENRC
jgi:hypothetical protein